MTRSPTSGRSGQSGAAGSAGADALDQHAEAEQDRAIVISSESRIDPPELHKQKVRYIPASRTRRGEFTIRTTPKIGEPITRRRSRHQDAGVKPAKVGKFHGTNGAGGRRDASPLSPPAPVDSNYPRLSQPGTRPGRLHPGVRFRVHAAKLPPATCMTGGRLFPARVVELHATAGNGEPGPLLKLVLARHPDLPWVRGGALSMASAMTNHHICLQRPVHERIAVLFS